MSTSYGSSINVEFHYSSSSLSAIYESGPEDSELDILRALAFSLVSETQIRSDISSDKISPDGFDDLIFLDYAGRVISSYEDLQFLYLDTLQIRANSNQYRILTLESVQDSDSGVFKINLWCILPNLFMNSCYNKMCVSSSSNEDDLKLLQCRYSGIDASVPLCHGCIVQLDPDLVIPDTGNDTAILKHFSCESNKFSDFNVFPQNNMHFSFFIDLPVNLYFRRTLYQKALLLQEEKYKSLLPSMSSFAISNKRQEIQRILQSGCSTVLTFEDINMQRQARSIVKFEKVIEYTTKFQENDSSLMPDVAFMHGLLQWFKCDHFKWVNKPPCTNPSCRVNIRQDPPVNQCMKSLGMTQPINDELSIGRASRVELYECEHCHQRERFPRFNNPAYLMTKSPRGRCGEFANAFGLLCRSLGFDVRYVHDLTDHVWIEVWLPSLHRFVHVDCCERALDSPLLYESGWGKKLTYIFSFSRYGVVDTTPKYTRCLNEVIMRRQELQYGDFFVQQTIGDLDLEVLRNYEISPLYTSKIVYSDSSTEICRTGGDDQSSAVFTPDRFIAAACFGEEGFEAMLQQELPMRIIHFRRQTLMNELEGMSFLSKKYLKLEEMQGRQSGSYEWRAVRGELGSACNTNTQKSEERTCV